MCYSLLFTIVLIELASFAGSLPLNQRGCNVSVVNLDPEPIITNPKSHQFWYPEPEHVYLLFQPGEEIRISCPGSTLTLQSNQFSTITAKCISNAQFKVLNRTVYFYDFRCSSKPRSSARYTDEPCGDRSGYRLFEIGFQITPQAFASQIQICFDTDLQVPLYSSHLLSKAIGHAEHGIKRPGFAPFHYNSLNLTISKLYSRKVQQITINQQLGLPRNSTKFLHKPDFFFSRGHLAPKADFVYAPQQLATFYYVNAAPQWQVFNGGNWNVLESDLREYAKSRGVDLLVYTGTYGACTLPHAETGEETQLYLGDQGAIPVPELLWKVVVDVETKRGVALVGLNNPYEGKGVYCEDVSGELGWLTWNSASVRRGLSYACTVEEFRRIVPYLPAIEVKTLLL